MEQNETFKACLARLIPVFSGCSFEKRPSSALSNGFARLTRILLDSFVCCKFCDSRVAKLLFLRGVEVTKIIQKFISGKIFSAIFDDSRLLSRK